MISYLCLDNAPRVNRVISYLAAQRSPSQVKASVDLIPDVERVYPFLVSFFYFGGITLAELAAKYGCKTRWFLDSGGFSAMTLGKRVALADYCRYIDDNAALTDAYVVLDVIGDAVKTARNFRIMENEGLHPCPIFHVGSDWQHLDAILEADPDYMCLGGMVPYLRGNQASLKNWMSQAFSRIFAKRPRKVHGLGLGSSIDLIDTFPWYSVDSSSWTSPYQYRVIDVFDDRRGKFVNVTCSKGSHSPMRNADLLRRYGMVPGQFYPPSRYDYAIAGALSLMSVMRAQDWVTGRHHDRDFSSFSR